MKSKQRLIALLLLLCTALALLPVTALAAQDGFELFEGTGVVAIGNFSVVPSRTYVCGQFSDVDEDAWYGANGYGAVKTACELGIVDGKGDGSFDPNGSVQLAEALKMAAVVHSIYTGGSGKLAAAPGKWWEPYVDYCIKNAIVTASDFNGFYLRAATRAEMAYIFANALPRSELSAINNVTALPDVDTGTPYCGEIFTLYRCGVLRGNDKYGTFTPGANIARAAAAAIIARIALPEQRLAFTLQTKEAAAVSYTPGMRIRSLGELEALYKQRVWGLYPDMRVRMSETLARQVWAQSDLYEDWVPMATDITITYSGNTDVLMEYEFTNYSPFFELDALMRDASVSARAGARAAGYLGQIDAVLASLSLSGKSERDKLLAIHDWMIAHIAYDLDFADASYWFYGPLDSGKAVCAGYAELFYCFANRAGIRCLVVRGMASSGAGMTDWGGHAWNVVYLTGDDTPYYIDVTYDDPIPDTTTGRRTYFMVTADTLSADHTW